MLLLLSVDHTLTISVTLALTNLNPAALKVALLAVLASLAFLACPTIPNLLLLLNLLVAHCVYLAICRGALHDESIVVDVDV